MISDNSCLKCHEKEDVHKVENDSIISLLVNKEDHFKFCSQKYYLC